MNIRKLFSISNKSKIFNLFEKSIKEKDSEILLQGLELAFKEQIDRDYEKYFLKLLPETWHEEHEELVNILWLENLNNDSFSDILYLIATHPETYRNFDDDNEPTLRKCIHVLKAINSEKSNSYVEKLKQTNNPNVAFTLENYK
ncbi:hypothetical protein G6N05_14970 [Flavobacterium sp. F372]|uniref:Immunity protein 30 domain-containing protein n=1 Tax=Flavobacterium bernardetii TaxID=2813823 RepID=A0ABR7J2G2_9FLAO|nr:hypothetical protein [Flavobacterium bernardetii]MBC5836167.1 hypothetical protein [Flavobacterium bernardetii]NHF71415.1 hypothetical protein [Flavobacterium bernardetii]